MEKKQPAMRLKAIYTNFPAIICLAAPPVLVWISGRLVLTPAMFERSGFGTGGEHYHFAIYYNIQRWASATSEILLVLKVLAVSCALDAGAYLLDLPVSFKKILRPVLFAEVSFFVGAVVKLIWFKMAYTNGTLQDWQGFHPLSLAMLFPTANVYLTGLLETLSVFEVAYWYLLAEGIRHVSGGTFDRCLQLVVRAYLPALLIWWLLISFLRLTLLSNA
ncbi:hypothetical protein EOD41_14910 [Mucilaginibacter limnophilus]|uniref:Yip1 domain-containing protein n=1 Tax=Mucilaginibacter limnophilus TaxID=1932778 RepID=A0A3S2Y1R1_9SPHI|nr:hypothetical protein [Mucilaginibacter limnophilus]RVT99732.1 hypothetical protein EOD41_14910 [Mucilaginibacter limnophilus]